MDGDDSKRQMKLGEITSLPDTKAAIAAINQERKERRKRVKKEQAAQVTTTTPPEEFEGFATIKVIGVGGGGCNAVERMIQEKMRGIEFLSINTDAQALSRCQSPTRIRIGDKLTKGLGVGGDPSKGAAAADESRSELQDALRDADMVFITAGLGGGTGTGAAPVVAEIAKQAGALTIGVVSKPFTFEGTRRRLAAEEGLERLENAVDTLIVIPNDRLLGLCDKKISLEAAFRTADDVLRQGIQGISELITIPGQINLDFADVRTVMEGAGPAIMAIGRGVGEARAVEAAQAAIASPLLDVSIEGARGVLFNVTGGSDLTLFEVQEAAEIIAAAVDPDANIIFGTVIDPRLENEVKITVIATGFDRSEQLGYVVPAQNAEPNTTGRLFEDQTELDVPPFLRRGTVLQN